MIHASSTTDRPVGPINGVYRIERAAAVLGWRPAYGFAEFLDALRAGRDSL